MYQKPPRTIMEVFDGLPEGTLVQVINNELVLRPSHNILHQEILAEIAFQLEDYVQEKQLGKVIIGPLDVYLNDENAFQPDIIFLSKNQMHLVQDGKIKGAPALVVEVLAPETENYDKKDKKEIYEQAGVKEYWIIEPSSKKVIGYQLTENGYKEIPSQNGVIQSTLLGATIHF